MFVYDPMGSLAQEYGPNSQAGTQYFSTDSLGSTRLITDTGANAVNCHDYLPFGEEITAGTAGRTSCYPQPPPPADGGILFTGKERDAESGLDFFGARYFSGAQGRFTSPDQPLIDQWESDPQSWNLYGYVRNNPLRYVDHGGQACVVDPKSGEQHNDDSGGQSCEDAAAADQNKQPDVTVTAQSPGIISQFLFAAVGHHGLPEWSKIPDSPAFRFFSRWFTGPLQNPQANYYDALHRELNVAAREIADDFLRQVGKNSLAELTKTEVKQLAQQLLDSNAPGVQNFMTRLEQLNPGATGTPSGLIDSIDFGGAFMFLVPGQQQLMNQYTCGASTCGSSGQVY